jgi:pimeloyl-ACP methyl ester carboxylesterase
MVQHLPRGHFAEIPDTAHTVNADKAEAFNALTAEFLQKA